jgi:hypothetical protein
MEGRVKEFTVCFLAVDWSLAARSYVDMAAICERFTPCHYLLLLPLLDRCEL